MGERWNRARLRPWLGGPALLILGGCAGRPAPPPAPPPVTTPVIEAPAPARTLSDEITAAAERVQDPAATPAARLAATDEVLRIAPGGAARGEIALATAALAGLDESAAAPDHLSAARQELDEAAPYGLDTVAAEADLEAAEAALAEGRRSLAVAHLERADCYLTCPRLAAAVGDLRAAITAGSEVGPAMTELAATGHLLEARGAVGRARRRVTELALAEARAELEAARREVVAWSGDDAARMPGRDALLADLDGALRDVEAASPGLEPRLEALWLKLAEPPQVMEKGTP